MRSPPLAASILLRASARVLPILALAAAMAGCTRRTEATLRGETMGTTYTVKIVFAGSGSPDRISTIRSRIDKTLQDVNGKMSTYLPDSELSRFNAHAASTPFKLSPSTFEVFEAALSVAEESGGALDITVKPLVDAWGFGPGGDSAPPPSDATIASLRERVGFRMLKLSRAASTVAKSRPDIECDLSSVAKGYAVDQVARTLESLGIRNYMVEVGGEIRTAGENPSGKAWRIAVEKPVPGVRAIDRVIPVSGLSVATSGDYRNYREVDGKRVCHIVDPRTGRPVAHRLAGVTVLHQKCVLADGYATAILVLGPDKGFRFAVRHGLGALLIVRTDGGFSEKVTPVLEQYLEARSGDREAGHGDR